MLTFHFSVLCTKKTIIYWVLMGIFLPFTVLAQNDTLVVENALQSELVYKSPSILIIKGSFVNFEDIINFGNFKIFDWLQRGEYRANDVCVRVTINNKNLTQAMKMNLFLGKQKIIEYCSQTNNGVINKYPFIESHLVSDYTKKDFFVPIDLPPHSTTTYWVKIQQYIFFDGIVCYFYPFEQKALSNFMNDFVSTKLFGFVLMVIGLFFFTSIIASFQAILTKDTTYWFWTLYLFINALFFAAELNRAFDLGFFNIKAYNKLNTSLPWPTAVQFLVSIFYLLFISSFLKLKNNHPKIYLFIKSSVFLMVLGFLFALYAVIVYDNNNTYDADKLLVLSNLLILIVIISIIQSKIPQKNLLMVGSVGVLLTATISIIIEIKEISAEVSFWLIPIVCYGLGAVWELACFSLALSQRSRLIQLENQQLQKNYAAQLTIELNERLEVIHVKERLLEEQRIKTLTTEFEQKIAETEISALRSQMNPHFIFNCLNSIKLYSLENDSEGASVYLTKFSKLIRLVLDNSRSERLTLEKEIETLRLYIEMEIMRFKEKVKYEINMSPEIDLQYVEIPPLLIQPFVENAIWHGLMHKEFGGKVSILLNLIAENMLEIQIIDNGVGREKSDEYKSKTATKHKSFGMKVTNERIELINQIYKTKAKVEIVDLYDEKQIGIGTKVIIQIPI